MSIRDLRTFLAIAQSGSFTAAANSVHRTQSAITVQMKALEEELEVRLFDRSKRPPLLTAAGRAFAPKAAEVVQAYELLFQEAGGAPVEGRLRLGSVPTMVTGKLPRALVALRGKYPRLRIELTMGLSADLVEKVRRGVLDAAIISEWREGSSGLEWSPLAYEPLVLIAPIDAPDRSAEELVTTLPFIRYTRQAWVGGLIDSFLRKRRLKVDEVMTLDTLEAITTMVHHGLGVSIVPLRGAADPFTLPVRRQPFSGPAVHRTIGLVQAAENSKAPLVETLFTELRNLWPTTEKPGRNSAKAVRGIRAILHAARRHHKKNRK
jgi:DNA-binding transcriptional LysR family regulator